MTLGAAPWFISWPRGWPRTAPPGGVCSASTTASCAVPSQPSNRSWHQVAGRSVPRLLSASPSPSASLGRPLGDRAPCWVRGRTACGSCCCCSTGKTIAVGPMSAYARRGRCPSRSRAQAWPRRGCLIHQRWPLSCPSPSVATGRPALVRSPRGRSLPGWEYAAGGKRRGQGAGGGLCVRMASGEGVPRAQRGAWLPGAPVFDLFDPITSHGGAWGIYTQWADTRPNSLAGWCGARARSQSSCRPRIRVLV